MRSASPQPGDNLGTPFDSVRDVPLWAAFGFPSEEAYYAAIGRDDIASGNVWPEDDDPAE